MNTGYDDSDNLPKKQITKPILGFKNRTKLGFEEKSTQSQASSDSTPVPLPPNGARNI
jgi:hypothetical protein